MRLFLGLELPLQAKNHIGDYLRPMKLSEKGWEKPHDYHQTLLFIGEASEEEVGLIKHRMDKFSFYPFTLQLTEFKFFNRRIMYLGMEQSLILLSLKKAIDEAFPEWCRPGEKPFIPHITVKRWQRYEHEHLSSNLQNYQFTPIKFQVNQLALFKSEKDPQDNKYHVIYTKDFLLKNAE